MFYDTNYLILGCRIYLTSTIFLCQFPIPPIFQNNFRYYFGSICKSSAFTFNLVQITRIEIYKVEEEKKNTRISSSIFSIYTKSFFKEKTTPSLIYVAQLFSCFFSSFFLLLSKNKLHIILNWYGDKIEINQVQVDVRG